MTSPTDLCERCKATLAIYHCSSCDPFHNYCVNCDVSVHSLPNKATHSRLQYFSNQGNAITYQYASSNKSSSYPMTSEAKLNDNGTGYSKEYVIELKRIFEKEKSDLQYKLTLMENNLERLKSTFQDQLQKMQNESTLLTTKSRMKEEDTNNKMQLLLKENQRTINNLAQDNDTLRKRSKSIEAQLSQLKERSQETSAHYNIQIKELQEENSSFKQLNEKIVKDKDEQAERLALNKRDDISALRTKHQKEMSDLQAEQRQQEEETKQEIELIRKEIIEVRKTNEQLHAIIDDLVKKQEMQKMQNSNICADIERMRLDLKRREECNDDLTRQLEKEKSLNQQMKADVNFFEKTINSLKKEIGLFKEVNTQIEKDYNLLMSQSEKMRKEYSKTILNNTHDKPEDEGLNPKEECSNHQKTSSSLTYEIKS